MYTPLLCLLGFAAWTLIVVNLGIVGVRVGSVLAGKARADAFPADTPHGSDRYRRTQRAHANCVENLPLFAAVVLTGAVVHAGSPELDTLAKVYLAARVGQSLVHIASGHVVAIQLRLALFFVQLVALVWMGVRVAQAVCAASLA